MGQDTSPDGASVTETREPEQIRADIQLTREQLDETVATLAEKADVKAHAKHKVDEAKATVSHKKDEVIGKAGQASPQAAASLVSRGSAKARERPLPLAGAFAAGLVVGRTIGRQQ
jgi:ElaB/YqjD/DUF883 family membrane-anchored ribosome-binding protein